MARVFISHASEDSAFAEQVYGWLIDDGHEVFSNQNLRDGIGVGEDWEQRLYERLRWADAVVCVITTAYVNSPWCSAEVAIARSRGSRLLPVLAESGVTEHPLLETLQYADAAQNGSAARLMLGEALRRVDRSGGLGWPDDRSPFPGLRPFDTDERMVFFGRGDEVARIAASLRSPAERADASALLVVGPSGCGKSSLVRAGLIPAMAAESDWLTLPAIMPGADPVAALVRALAEGAQDAGLYWTVGEVRSRLTKEGFRSLVDELLVAARCQRLLVVVDQFEELLNQTPPAERIAFAKLLRTGVVAGLVHVVATLRPEFLEQVLLSPELAVLPTQTHTLRPLRREALRAVIEGPADLAGISVDSDLVTRLITDTDSGEALPLLAYALAELAEGVTRGGALLPSRYEQIGGVQGALTRQADAALAEAVKITSRAQDQVIADLLRLVTVDEEGRPTRLRVRRDELPEETAAELDAFVARRLLTTDSEDGQVVLGVAHEAFLSAWPPLAEAITAASSALRAGRAVEVAAADWDERNRPPDRLWEGGQVAAALTDTGARFQKGLGRDRKLITDRVRLGETAREFLQASVRHDRRRRRRATTVLTFLLVIALAGAGVAFGQRQAAQVQQGLAQDQQRLAEKQQRIATSRQLVTQAESVRNRDPRTALRLGLAAHKIYPDRDTEFELIETLTATLYAGALEGHSDAVIGVKFGSDGQTLVGVGFDETVLLWDLTDRAVHRRLGQISSTGVLNSVALAPDGQTLAAIALDQGPEVLLWDLAEKAKPRVVEELPSTLLSTATGNSVAFAPDGETLATVLIDNENPDQELVLWDLADRESPRRIGKSPNNRSEGVGDVTFSPDGRTLAAAGFDGTLLLWDITDRAKPRRLGELLSDGSEEVASVAFAPDGQTLASAGVDGTLLLWDLTDRDNPRRLGKPLTGTNPSLTSLAFAPDGLTLAGASDDGSVVLWDVADRDTPRSFGEWLSNQASGVKSVAFAPYGLTFATGMSDGSVMLWELGDRAMPRRLGETLSGKLDVTHSVAFAPDGQTVAIANGREGDHYVMLRDLAGRSKPQRLRTMRTGDRWLVRSPVFAPDGRNLAAVGVLAGEYGEGQVWDLTDTDNPRALGKSLTGGATSLAFAPDGQVLAIAAGGVGIVGTVELWDLTDRAKPRLLGEPLTYQSSSEWMTSVAFAPDGLTLASVADGGTVLLWDLTDRSRPRRLGEPITDSASTGVISLAFSPDGKTLAAAGNDDKGTVQLWDLTDRTKPRRLGEPLTGHTGGVTSVVFAPHGLTLASAGFDGTALLWDLTDRSRPRRLGEPLTGHSDSNWDGSMAFAPDGQTLATAGGNGTLLWNLGGLHDVRENSLVQACSIAERGLQPEEWSRYIPDLAYQESCPI